jgi:hypothetical protein
MDGGDFAVGQGACEAAVPVDSLLELKPNSSVWGVVVSSRKEPQSHETSPCAPFILRMAAVVYVEMLQQLECTVQLNAEGWCHISCSQKHL